MQDTVALLQSMELPDPRGEPDSTCTESLQKCSEGQWGREAGRRVRNLPEHIGILKPCRTRFCQWQDLSATIKPSLPDRTRTRDVPLKWPVMDSWLPALDFGWDQHPPPPRWLHLWAPGLSPRLLCSQALSLWPSLACEVVQGTQNWTFQNKVFD